MVNDSDDPDLIFKITFDYIFEVARIVKFSDDDSTLHFPNSSLA